MRLCSVTITHAITVHGWWARAILDCGKRVENRSRPIPRRFVGVPVALHAGRQVGDLMSCAHEWARARAMNRPENDGKTIGDAEVDTSTLMQCIEALRKLGPAGIGIVGVVTFTGEGRTIPGWVPWGMLESPCWWMIDKVRKFPVPIPCRGQLGFWRLPAEVAQQVNNAEVVK